MKPNKALKNNSSGENFPQSLWLIGNNEIFYGHRWKSSVYEIGKVF